jgi:hypothetical protein
MIKTKITVKTNKAFICYREILGQLIGRPDIKFPTGKNTLKQYSINRLKKIATIHAKGLRDFLRKVTPNGTGELAAGAKVIGPSEPSGSGKGFNLTTGIYDNRVMRYRANDIRKLEEGFESYAMRGSKRGGYNKEKYRRIRAWVFMHLAEIKKRKVAPPNLRNPKAAPIDIAIRTRESGRMTTKYLAISSFIHRGIRQHGMFRMFTDMFLMDVENAQSNWISNYLSYVFPFIKASDLSGGFFTGFKKN